MANKRYKFGTKAIHAGVKADPATGAIMTPIYQTSTYKQDKVGQTQGFEYSRSSNPTRKALENAVAALENAKFGACFGSGIAAVDAVLKMLHPGDEVITTGDLYGGSYRLFKSIFENYGIKFHFLNMNDLELMKQTINKNTRLIWVETPTNPLLNIIDIEAISKVIKNKDILLGVDNTFATPYLQNPIDLGADIVVHSATKYIGGHSDVVLGATVTDDKEIADKIYHIQNSTGGIAGPMDSFLVLRGLKTLHLRMQRHCENGEKIAHFLQDQPQVNKVFWPGFKTHPNHEVAKNQMQDFGGMLSFSLKVDDMKKAHSFMENLEIFAIAESLGGVESLASHPASMSHAAFPKKERQKAGIDDSLIRLSIGIEDTQDLLNDLKNAFA